MFKAHIKLNNGHYETIDVYEWYNAPLPAADFEKLGSGRNDKNQRKRYYNLIITLDSETSKQTYIDDEGVEQVQACWIYQWACRIGNIYVAGRQADEILWFLKRLIDEYDLDDKHRLVVWIHNAAYDLSYLINGFIDYFDDVDMFSVAPAKIIKCTLNNCLEIRCSWKLVNKSLAAWCKDVNPMHAKQSGEIDYNELRTPCTELSEADWDYMLNDVASQYDCLVYTLKDETLASVPMTSTGFVRRAMRQAAYKDSRWKGLYQQILLTPRQYKLIKALFVGGYTHANSWDIVIRDSPHTWSSGQLKAFDRYISAGAGRAQSLADLGLSGIEQDVLSFDAASMYPAVQATELYPMGKWCWRRFKTDEDLDWACQTGYAMAATVVFTNLRLKVLRTWNPYISYSKIKGHMLNQMDELDNGKVIKIDGKCVLNLMELDWKWIRKQYEWDDCEVLQAMTSQKMQLPVWFRNELRQWYQDKTTLKGAESDDDQRRYMESKQRLNACYGMTATDIIHDEIEYSEEDFCWHTLNKHTDEGIAETIEKLQRPYSNEFLPYQWGAWCTAQARDRLFTVAECCGNPLYCDTDSIKGYNWDFEKLDAINAAIEAKSRAAGFVACDNRGREHVIGVFEYDGHYQRFVALHAKCYAYETLTSEELRTVEAAGQSLKLRPINLHCTIAGVTKDNGQPKKLSTGDRNPLYISKEMELGSIEQLRDGKVFKACGGTRSQYIMEPHSTTINGEHIDSWGGCAILNTTYEIGGTFDLLRYFTEANPDIA